MKKRKLLFSIVALLCSVGAWADTSKLLTTDGWSKITTMPSSTDIANNYYVFVDNERDLMLGTGKGVEQNKTWYSLGVYYYTSVSPTSSSINNMVWTLEKTNSYGDNGFALRNLENSVLCFQAESDGAWKYDTNDVTSPNEWAQVIFSYADGSWTLQNGKFGGTNYIGPWSDSNFTNGAECAANKSGNNVGHFQIYAISRAQFKQNLMDAASSSNPVDLTPWYVTNATFDANNSDGWTIDFSANSSGWWGSHAFSNLGAENYQQVAEVHQNLTLPNGKYKVALQGASNKVSENLAYVFATHNGSTEKTFFTQSTVESLDGDKWSNMQYNLLLMMQNRSYGQVQTPEVTVTTGSLTIGYKNGSGHSWDVYDNFKLYYTGTYVSHVATSFTNGTAATADQWYKVTVSAGEYVVKDTVASTIYWTQDGEKYVNDNDFSSFSLGAGESKILTLTAGTFYFKSSATGNAYVTKIDETNLPGWTRVEDLATLQTNPEDYFYAIFSAETSNLLVRTNTSNGEPYYVTGANPFSNLEYVYEIENYTYDSKPFFVMKSLSTHAYYYPIDNNAYDLEAPSSGKTAADDACRLTFAATNGVWRISTWAVYHDGSYLGRWYSDTKPYITGERLAGNKKASVAGSFLIYRIAKENCDFTAMITNPSFESDTPGSDFTKDGTNDETAPTGWSFNTTATGAPNNNNSQWGPANSSTIIQGIGTSFSPSAGSNYYYIRTNWNGGKDFNISQTLNNLPTGQYQLTCKMATYASAETTTWTLSLKEGSSDAVETSTTVANSSWTTYTVDIAKSEASTNLTIKANMNAGTANTGYHFLLLLDDFQLKYISPLADSDDYTALNSAITAASSKTLGFDEGEYAPYSNADAVIALAAAQAINQSVANGKTAVSNATTTLSGATWTPNGSELNAFYRGTFNEYAEDTTSPLDYTPNGWTASSTMRMMLKNATNYPGLADASATTALMSHPGGITYGETTGYTMPLKANTIYELKFKAAGWNNETRSGMTVYVLNSSDGLAATNLGTPDRDIKGNETNTAGMTSYSKLFKTGAAGNYVFHIQSGHNFVITDFELKRGGITITEDAASAPMTGIANVTLERAFNAGWNAVCLPFATAAFDDAKIADFTGETIDGDNVTLQLTKVDAFEANKPYLVYFPSAVSSGKTFNQVEIESGTIKTSQTVFDFMGTMVMTDIEAGSWVISGGKLKKASTSISLKPTRTYFVPKGSSARIAAFNFDGETPTGITFYESDNQLEFVNEAYNLSGQKINGKLKKGIYIVNGKKTVVK